MSLQQKIWGLGVLALAVALGLVWVVGLLSGASLASLWGAAVGGLIVLLVMGVSLRLTYGGALQTLALGLRAGCEPHKLGQSFCIAPEAAPADMKELYAAAADLSDRACHSSGVLHGILAGMPLAYLLVDANEKATHTNQECLDMLEIDGPVKNCIGKTLAELFYNDPGRETAVGKSIRHGQNFRNLSVVIAGHKGRRIDVLANVFPVYDVHGTCLGGLCLYVDMTALKEAEQVITDKNQRMEVVAQELDNTVQELRLHQAFGFRLCRGP